MKTTEIAAVDGMADAITGDPGQCVCCREGRHVWSRNIWLQEGNVSRFITNTLREHPEIIGKRVRLTVSLIED